MAPFNRHDNATGAPPTTVGPIAINREPVNIVQRMINRLYIPPAISLSSVEHPTNVKPNNPNNHRTLTFLIVISINDHSLISFQAA
jgi:hypothetical protein